MRGLLPVRVLIAVCLALASRPAPGRAEDHPLRDGLALERCAAPGEESFAGVPLALLCQLSDRGLLGGPLDEFAPAFRRLRAGVLGAPYPYHRLHYARSSLGEPRFLELLAVFEEGRVLSRSSFPDWNEPRILRACAASAADPADRARCALELEQLLSAGIDAHADELMAAKRDRLRFEFLDFDRPLPRSADWLDAFSVGYALSFTSFDPSTLPRHSPATGVEGRLIVPLFVGPDGIAFTPDDLPLPIEASDRLRRRAPYPGSTWDESFSGDPVFDSIAVVDGTFDERGGLSVSDQPLVLYGVLSKRGLERLGCAVLGGSFVAGSCLAAGDVPVPRADLFQAGCHTRTAQGTQGGFNSVGECVLVNLDRGSAKSSDGDVSRTLGMHADDLRWLSEPGLRPASATLEPSDLTDFMSHALGRRSLPTRPRIALDAPPIPPARPSRRVDPLTGAPVRRTGPALCTYRAAGASDPALVGPDGVRATSDDLIPSSGNCLLFDPPADPDAAQRVRPEPAILADHPVHQEMFRRLCGAAFDDDDGHCGLDAFNHLRAGEGLERILNGSLLLAEASSLAGIESIRLQDQTPAAYSWRLTLEHGLEPLTHLLRPDLGPLEVLPLTSTEGALLGCGPGFARACGLRDEVAVLGRDSSVARALGVESLQQVPRGPDLEFADASVLLQESPLEKALSPGALVGARADGAGFEAGIQAKGLSPEQVRSLSEPERAALVHGELPTDAWVEPYPWALDPEALARGIVLFEAADSLRLDARCDPERPGRTRDATGAPIFGPGEIAYCSEREPHWADDPNVIVLNDPTDPSNPANRLVPDGENCSDSIAGLAAGTTAAGSLFRDGCTALEYLSSNFWRAQIGFEVIGRDRAFDPPETVQELVAMLDGDPANDLDSDPVAGADGIAVKNVRAFSEDEVDVHALLFSQPTPGQLPLPELDTDGDGVRDLGMQDFFDQFVPSDCPTVFCRLRLGTAVFVAGLEAGKPQTRPLVSALPIAMRMRLVSIDGVAPPPEFAFPHVNVLEVYETDRRAFADLYDERPAHIGRIRLRDAQGEVVELRGDLVVRFDPLFNVHPLLTGNIDLELIGVQDIDQDADGVYDGLDDGSPGPVADDSVLCGSGLPGDFLQAAAQLELRSRSEEQALRTRFPDGLPPRSPVFCGSLLRWHGFTRRDPDGVRRFRWHVADPAVDRDRDGVLGAVDNCPLLANPDQLDRGGSYPAPALSDGTGDACQCGDVSDNGRVSATDGLLLRLALRRIGPFSGGVSSLGAPERCDVNRDSSCDDQDALQISRSSLGLIEPLGACPAAGT